MLDPSTKQAICLKKIRFSTVYFGNIVDSVEYNRKMSGSDMMPKLMLMYMMTFIIFFYPEIIAQVKSEKSQIHNCM